MALRWIRRAYTGAAAWTLAVCGGACSGTVTSHGGTSDQAAGGSNSGAGGASSGGLGSVVEAGGRTGSGGATSNGGRAGGPRLDASVDGADARGRDATPDSPSTDGATHCSTDAACGAGRCNPVTGTCQDCLFHTDCPTDEVCALGVCRPGGYCLPAVGCFDGRSCDALYGRCVECSTSFAWCPDGRACHYGFCDDSFVKCTSAADCPNNGVCPNGVCAECSLASPCKGGRTCVSGKCRVTCSSDGECAANGFVCAPERGCVPCTSNTECKKPSLCIGYECVLPRCDPGRRTCVYGDSGRSSVLICNADGTSADTVACGTANWCVEANGDATCGSSSDAGP